MNVYVNKITGLDDAIVSMYMSKRSWNLKLEQSIRELYDDVTDSDGTIIAFDSQFEEWVRKLLNYGINHTTLLRFIDFSITVEGIHRAGQDDWGSHAKRFENRIVRSSTRLSTFKEGEMSDYYKERILSTDLALKALDIKLPEAITIDGKKYVKQVNGYILESEADKKDVKRGLYMLSIPSNFIFKVNLTEWAHVYKERNEKSGANPEVKQLCETIATEIEKKVPYFNREVFKAIKN
ncbi:MAG: FAD-dependent thymidylate synthase [Lachnospiraceae bacterium]|nr:FAD-dependent thymidylate synthase [Lachnospiraceae bacterium]